MYYKLKYNKYKIKYLNLKYNKTGGKNEIKFIGEFKPCKNSNKDCHKFDGVILDNYDNLISKISTQGIWKENSSINNIKNITFTDTRNKKYNYSWKQNKEWTKPTKDEFEKIKSIYKPLNKYTQIITSGFFFNLKKINILTWKLGLVNGDNHEDDLMSTTCNNAIEKNKKSCQENINEFINKKKYEIIGLQEASNWELFYNNKLKNNMGLVNHSINKDNNELNKKNNIYNTEIITFYDMDRFIPIYSNYGIIKLKLNCPTTYHLIFFEEKDTAFKYIVINIFTENDDVGILEELVNKNINKCFELKKNNNIHKLNYYKEPLVDITDYIKNNTFKIIVLGHFNQYGFWKGFNIINNMVSSNGIEPPKTCCADARKIKEHDTRLGNYILINSELSYIVNCEVPKNFEINSDIFPTCSNLPVEATII